jgi:nitric oxide reductase activation protein
MVYGHTAQEENQHECTMIEYKTDLVDNSHLLGGASSRCQNLDGVAINFMGQAMDKVHVSGKKFLIIISDGSPNGYFYGGSSSQKHTFKACKTARSKGIKVFGIGICNAFSPAIGNALYGNGNFVVIDNTLDSLKIMTNQLKKFTASI